MTPMIPRVLVSYFLLELYTPLRIRITFVRVGQEVERYTHPLQKKRFSTKSVELNTLNDRSFCWGSCEYPTAVPYAVEWTKEEQKLDYFVIPQHISSTKPISSAPRKYSSYSYDIFIPVAQLSFVFLKKIARMEDHILLYFDPELVPDLRKKLRRSQ